LDFAIEPAVSDGNKASIAPPHRAGTVLGFLSNLLQKFVYLEKSMAFSATLYASGVFQQIEGQLVRFDNSATIYEPAKATGHEVPAMKESVASVVMGSHRFAKNGIERFKRQTNGDKK
jgi:hypothetical protein